MQRRFYTGSLIESEEIVVLPSALISSEGLVHVIGTEGLLAVILSEKVRPTHAGPCFISLQCAVSLFMTMLMRCYDLRSTRL